VAEEPHVEQVHSPILTAEDYPNTSLELIEVGLTFGYFMLMAIQKKELTQWETWEYLYSKVDRVQDKRHVIADRCTTHHHEANSLTDK
jgi:hypothetical protein